MKVLLYVAVCIVYLNLHDCAQFSGIHDTVFRTAKVDGYEPQAIPICKIGDKLHVAMDAWLFKLFDLDEPTQLLTLEIYVDTTWKDCRISWDKSRTQVEEIYIKSEEIWKPDLTFYQSLHGNFEEGMFILGESVARIRDDGFIHLGAKVQLRAFCRVAVDDFPFDTQRCNLTFTSWTKDARVFNLTSRREHKGAGDRGHSLTEASNGEWDVLEFSAHESTSSLRQGIDETTARNFTEVTFSLLIRRKPLYLQLYMIFPCMVLTWMAVVVFIIPIESGEKIQYSTTILLSIIVLLLVIANIIPRTSDGVPVLSIFFVMSILNVSLALVATCFVLNIGLKSTDICMPKPLCKMLHLLSRWMCFIQDEHGKTRLMSRRNKGAGPDLFVAVASTAKVNHWRILATVLDRFFMVIYVILNLIATVYLLCYHK